MTNQEINNDEDYQMISSRTFEDRLFNSLEEIRNSVNSVKDRVNKLEEQSAQSTTNTERHSLEQTVETQSANEDAIESQSDRHWDDRHSEHCPEDDDVIWPVSDEEGESPQSTGIKLFQVSEKTGNFLKQSFTNTAPNKIRRQWREKLGAPNTPYTACPTLDKIVKSRLSPTTKSRDKTLAKTQALLLDAVGPITYILEEAAKGQLTSKGGLEAAQSALKLLGNASMHITRDRRKNAIESMNPNLIDLAEDDSMFQSAPPLLFGEGFAKKAKERDEELKCLNQATKQKTQTTNNSYKVRNYNNNKDYFQGSRPHYQSQRGGGQFNGNNRRYQRHHPYARNNYQSGQKKTGTIPK